MDENKYIHNDDYKQPGLSLFYRILFTEFKKHLVFSKIHPDTYTYLVFLPADL